MQTQEIYRFQNGPVQVLESDGKTHLKWQAERLFEEIVSGLKKAKELGKIP